MADWAGALRADGEPPRPVACEVTCSPGVLVCSRTSMRHLYSSLVGVTLQPAVETHTIQCHGAEAQRATVQGAISERIRDVY